MYRLLYMPSANDDILEAEAYPYELSPSASKRFVEALKDKTATLTEDPFLYSAYEDDSYFRRMGVGDYLLFYSVDEKRRLVVIHHVFHAERDVNRLISEHGDVP